MLKILGGAAPRRLTTSSSSPSTPNPPSSTSISHVPTNLTFAPVAFPPNLEARIRKVEVLGGKEDLIPLEAREDLARNWEAFMAGKARPVDSQTQFVGNFVLILFAKSKDPAKVEEVRVLRDWWLGPACSSGKFEDTLCSMEIVPPAIYGVLIYVMLLLPLLLLCHHPYFLF